MPSKKARPEVFGDKYRRCLISSIASYEATSGGSVSIYLKSGETVVLQFHKDYLQGLAMARLDAYFALEVSESNCCNVCANKDVPVENPTQFDKIICDGCYSGRKSFTPSEGVKNE